MATNRRLEAALSASYPNTMRHLRQLLMDAEDCAKTYGKTSFFGKDKFQPKKDKLAITVGECLRALVKDNHLADTKDLGAAMKALNVAVLSCEQTYSRWPLAFGFWQ